MTKLERVRTVCIGGSTPCGCTCDSTREKSTYVQGGAARDEGERERATNRWSRRGLSSLVRGCAGVCQNIRVITRLLGLAPASQPASERTHRPLFTIRDPGVNTISGKGESTG